MHVVQILPELNEGGVERGAVECNREFVRRGVTSTVLSRGGRLAPEITRDGGQHRTYDVCSKNLLTAPARVYGLRRLLADLKPDIVHVRSRVPAWLTHFANRSLRLPLVTTVHGFNRPNAYSRIMTRGDRVICVSQAVKTYIQQHYGTPDAVIRVIHRGLDAEAFDPLRLDAAWMSTFRRQWGLDDRFLAVSAGRITELKDHATFIRAIAQARRELPTLLGLIVGGVRDDKRAYFASLQALVASLGMTDAIVFAGNQRQMAEIYAMSRVAVSSSLQPESFGRSMVEALAMGCPVIASRHGGALEIVREGENGFFFAPGDVAGLAGALLAASRQSFTGLRADVMIRFALSRMIDDTLNVYRELLNA